MIISHLIHTQSYLISNISRGYSNVSHIFKFFPLYRKFNCFYSTLNTYPNNIYKNQNLQHSTPTLNTNHVEHSHNVEDSIILAHDSATLNLNQKQLCRSSHKNFLLYSYNNFDFDTIIKINNQVLAPYQTSPKRKTEVHRKQYLSKFLKCISKHKPTSDHEMVSRWLIRCIDLLTSHDMYSMLRVRYILNYDNSFETLRSSYGIDTLEKFSNVQRAKEIREKVLEEKASKNKTAKRNLLMRYLKINKIKFLRDQNITKAVYEASIEWNDQSINNKKMEESRYAFIYNLPFIEFDVLKEKLTEVLSKFGRLKNIEIIDDRVPPLARLANPNNMSKNHSYDPKDKYSPLYAIVEFENSEDRNSLCSPNIRVFGILFFGRMIYPEFAEYKHSLITAIYPPFKKMSGALQFIANTLVDIYDDSDYDNQTHEFSTCKITPLARRKKKNSSSMVVTAEKNIKESNTPEENKQIKDNHIDPSMMEDIKKDSLTDLDPQWIVLRFNNFKNAYYARQKLVEQISSEPRSFVSFDTKRSVFHNGEYIDLPLFRYSQDNETDITYTNLAKIQTEID
ncbi:hypothetical protein TpMuguga_04g00495 [Theileria parva strain Muguga]|uniref:RRM domain-containing protein n=1 Tax=Theileria parva TaxID=5875 RepID=Q4N3I6_THEPA|nr:uncharacterized protein TpMuguga_04g00495 [Theileria parva strain Muguga]EAN31847.1 hypothetical protein TpMuguga_04g00495 [Theileria parva strain Muguga]|eukprot:XP_764130.1 hypothetical protein [Theileria parva strain Muguga]